MRQLGSLADRRHGSRLVTHLSYRHGITASCDAADPTTVWIEHEDDWKRARTVFERFALTPDADRYVRSEEQVALRQARLREAVDEEKQRTRTLEQKRERRLRLHRRGLPWTVPVTMGLLLLSLIVKLSGIDATAVTGSSLPAQLIGAMFFHVDLIALFFNLCLLHDLGSRIESLRGSRTLALLVLCFGGLSALVQVVTVGVALGGMAGVVHGLFGYCLASRLVGPRSGVPIHPRTALALGLWLVACCAGLVTLGVVLANLTCLFAGFAVTLLASKRKQHAALPV